MRVTKTMRDDVAVVALSGSLNCGNGDEELQRLMADLERQGHVKIVLDVTQVSHIDTTCLGLLIGARMRLVRLGGGLHLIAPSYFLYVLEIAKLKTVLVTFGSEEEAVRAFAAAA
ncbi:MAG TPA: STAS domain-containing protein [Vicinamibacterales bacterium]|nr:STAS domain-containing protein [Vicinamibacterales bacterium]